MNRKPRTPRNWTICGLLALALCELPLGGARAQTATDLICSGCVGAGDIASFTVSAGKLSINSVTNPKIATGAVTQGKIANRAVTGPKIESFAVSAGKLSINSVTNPKIATGAVTQGKIATGAVTAAKLGADVLAVGLTGVSAVSAAALTSQSPNSSSYLFTQGHMRGSGNFVAPVYLPDGAIIDELEAFVVHEDAFVIFLDVRLRRVDLVTGITTTMGSVGLSFFTSTEITILNDTSIQNATVDLLNYAYFLEVSMDSTLMKFYAARIYYH